MLTDLEREAIRVAREHLKAHPQARTIEFAISSEQPLRPWTFDLENFRPHRPVTHTIHVTVLPFPVCRERGHSFGYWFSVDGGLILPVPDCPRCLWIWLWETVFELITTRHMGDDNAWLVVAERFYYENTHRLEYAEMYWTDTPKSEPLGAFTDNAADGRVTGKKRTTWNQN